MLQSEFAYRERHSELAAIEKSSTEAMVEADLDVEMFDVVRERLLARLACQQGHSLSPSLTQSRQVYSQ